MLNRASLALSEVGRMDLSFVDGLKRRRPLSLPLIIRKGLLSTFYPKISQNRGIGISSDCFSFFSVTDRLGVSKINAEQELFSHLLF